MLRIPSLGPAPAAMVGSLALHLGVAAGFAARSPSAAPQPVDIEFTSTATASADPLPRPNVAPRPPPQPSPPLPPARARGGVRRAEPNRGASSATPSPPSFSLPGLAVVGEQPRFVLPSAAPLKAVPAPAPLAPAAHASSTGSEPTLSEAQVDVPARLIKSAPVTYPRAARSAEIEASVALEIVVGANGRVLDQRPLARAGYGLEEAALAAIRAYRFSPAQRSGRPVPVRMRWSVLFQLR